LAAPVISAPVVMRRTMSDVPTAVLEVPTALEANILPVTHLIVKNGAGSTTYQLVLDYNAIAKAQAHPELSKRQVSEKGVVRFERRDLSQVLHWAGMTGPDLTLVAWAALDRYHTEVELRTLRQWLAPAQFDQLFVMLVEQCYPGIMERVRVAMEAEEKKSTVAPQVQKPEPQAPGPETGGTPPVS